MEKEIICIKKYERRFRFYGIAFTMCSSYGRFSYNVSEPNLLYEFVELYQVPIFRLINKRDFFVYDLFNKKSVHCPS